MNPDLARSRRLQRIADFALSGTAALLGVVLLAAAVFHLLAPAAVSTAPFEPGASAVVGGVPRRVPTSIGPAARAQRATATSRGDRPRTAFDGAARRATFPNRASAQQGPARHAARTTAPASARPSAAATTRLTRVTSSHPAATGRLEATLVRASGLRAPSIRAAMLRTGPVPANPPQAPAAVPQARLRQAVPAHLPLATKGRAPGSRRPEATSGRGFTRLAARPPRGYDPRPKLARIPIEAVPAVPAGTTPVRGSPPRSAASAGASAPTSAPGHGALDPFQNAALPSL